MEANGEEISLEKSKNCWIFEMWIIQPKPPEILGKNKMEWKFSITNFRKFKYPPQDCSLFWKFWKLLPYSQLEFPDIQTRIFGRMGSTKR